MNGDYKTNNKEVKKLNKLIAPLKEDRLWGEQMKNFTTQDIINEYIQVGLILEETYLNGNYKKGNSEEKNYKAI